MRKSKLARKPSGKVKSFSFSLKGGLNLVDSPLTISNGMALTASNFELLTTNGIRRLLGFERYDGQKAPSDEIYWVLNYDAGTTAIRAGDVVLGLISGATGEVLIDQVGSVAIGYLVLINVNGSFVDNELLEVAATASATSNGSESPRGAPTPELDTTYLIAAIEAQRAKIGIVGAGNGSGPVRGMHVYKGDKYAFRDNASQTYGIMYKATPNGWVAQNLGLRIHFTDDGTGVAYVEGEVITGSSSGATATILRVVLQSGAWGIDAKGYFIVATVTVNSFSNEATTGSISGSIPVDGGEIANTMAPGGRYEFENYNFFGTDTTARMYGVNGVSEAFEFDGTVFVPIITGNIVDKPSHLAVNEYHLHLAFANGSLQNSDTGKPYVWAGGGASEIGTGNRIVGLKKEVGGALVTVCRDRTFALHGKNTTASPYNLKVLSDEAGGIEWTLQRLGSTRYLDDRGFMDVKAVLDFGDFNTSTFSQLIEPLILVKKKLAISSIIIKRKSQIRTFFSDGTGIIATFNNNKLSGFTTLRYTDAGGSAVLVRCTANGEDSQGSEKLFFGSDNGYVYEMDKGPSFDGGEISATLQVSYSHLGTPAYDKQYKKVIMEVEGSIGTTIKYNTLIDYSSGRSPGGITHEAQLKSSGFLWDSVNWNAFTWASEDVSRVEGSLAGVGRNIGLQISSISTYNEPYTIYAITYNYIRRKLVR